MQHLADDPVYAFGVVADHQEQPLALRRDRAVFLEELRRLVDRGEGIAHLVRDAGGESPHRRELHLLRLALRAAEIFEVDERAAVESGADSHQAHAQEPLRCFDLERRQRFGEILLPPTPVIVQDRAELGQPHPASHAPEPAQEPRHLCIVAAHDPVQVDHQHAVLHVLDDEPVHLPRCRARSSLALV